MYPCNKWRLILALVNSLILCSSSYCIFQSTLLRRFDKVLRRVRPEVKIMKRTRATVGLTSDNNDRHSPVNRTSEFFPTEETIRLTNTDGTHNKFWQIRIENMSTITTYGRIGSSGASTIKEHADPETAKAFALKEISKKRSKGYAGGNPDLDKVVDASSNSKTSAKPSNTISPLLSEWVSDWYCYWDGSYGMPQDHEKDYVFKPPLSERMDGIVFSSAADPSQSETTDSAVRTLLGIQEELGDENLQCLFTSESDYTYLPILINLADGEELNAAAVLQALGAHKQLLSSVKSFVMEGLLHNQEDAEEKEKLSLDEDNPDDDVRNLSKLYNCLRTSSAVDMKPLIFYCGSDKLNPVPFFVVTRLSPSLVGGFISGIIHT